MSNVLILIVLLAASVLFGYLYSQSIKKKSLGGRNIFFLFEVVIMIVSGCISVSLIHGDGLFEAFLRLVALLFTMDLNYTVFSLASKKNITKIENYRRYVR